MSSEWPRVEVGQLAKLRSGFPFKSADWKVSGVPVIKIANVKAGRISLEGCGFVSNEVASKSAEWFTRAGDVLITMTGYVGEVAQVKSGERYLINQRVGRFDFTPNAAVEPKYFFYHLQHPDTRAEIEGVARGSAQPNLSAGDAHKIKVTLPPLENQIEIAATLGALDDRITLLRETNATLEAIAQALFKSWFVDFDPVRAKQEGRAPEGMSDATAALFPDALEETELGPVPKGWRYSTIGESFILTMGQSPPGDTYNEAGDGLPFYQGRTDFGFRFPSQRVFCTAPTRLAEPGDTLVSVRAPVGDVNMALEKCCVGRGVAAVRHPNGCRSFAFYATRGLRSRFDLFDSEGTVFGSINKKDFQALPVIEPSGDVLVAFDEIAAPIDRRIVGNEEQIRTLATLRDTLLPRLISGQLRVPEAIEATLA